MLKISNKKRSFVSVIRIIPDDTEVVLRSSQHHFDVIKAGISDGVSSSTGIFDEAIGDVPEVFNQNYDNLDIADALLRGNVGARKASDIAEKGVQVD